MLNRSAYGRCGVTKQNNRWLVQRMVNGQTLRATFNTESEARWYSKNLDARMDAIRQALPDGSLRNVEGL